MSLMLMSLPVVSNLRQCSLAMRFSVTTQYNWKQCFKLYMSASGNNSKSKEAKSDILFHVVGTEALEIYNSFTWEQCGPQNLNTEGMHTSFANAIMAGCLVVFEGMKAASSLVQRVLRLL